MKLLNDVEISEALSGSTWSYQGKELVKSLRRNDFAAALELVNSIGVIADRLGHHPDIDIRWNVVVLRLSTHSMGGVTKADIDLARALDTIF